MAIVRIDGEKLQPLSSTTFGESGISERQDLQRLLRANVEILDPDILVIAEEFSEWHDSQRRIDLLAIDRDARLVVIELKRDDSAHMELQALRYAAMVSPMTFDQICRVLGDTLRTGGIDRDPVEILLEHVGMDVTEGEDASELAIGDPRIVLVSSDFSREVTTTVLWLLDKGIDIRCVRMRPCLDGDNLYAEVQQVLPLPEVEEYLTRLRDKRRDNAAAAESSRSVSDFRKALLPEFRPVGERLLDWFSENSFRFYFGSARGGVSCVPILDVGRENRYLLRFTTKGKVEIRTDWVRVRPPFDDPADWRELIERLNRAGLELPCDVGTSRPSFALSQLDEPSAMEAFLSTVEWWAAQVRQAEGQST